MQNLKQKIQSIIELFKKGNLLEAERINKKTNKVKFKYCFFILIFWD